MYRTILVPLDGSEHAEVALAHAEALARAFGSRIEIARAVMVPTLIGTLPEVALPPSFDAGVERRAVLEYLGAQVERLRQQGVESSCEVLEGPAAEAVLEHARRTGADLVVLSSHGRGGFRRWVHGSTAEKISRHSPCPVLMVRPEQPRPAAADPPPQEGSSGRES